MQHIRTFVTSYYNKLTSINLKYCLHLTPKNVKLLMISVLLLGLIASVVLVRQSQDIRGRAKETDQKEVFSIFLPQIGIPQYFSNRNMLSEYEKNNFLLADPNKKNLKINTEYQINKLNNVTASITSPENQDYFRIDTNITINGIASASGFLKYNLESYPETDPENITKIIESFRPVEIEGLLAVWKAPKISGKWILKLTVYYQDGEYIQTFSDQQEVHLDSNLRQGWPVKIDDTTGIKYYISNPIVSDLNQDGKVEIILNFRNNIYIYTESGYLLWKKRIRGNDSSINYYQPAIEDIDPNYVGREIIAYIQDIEIDSQQTTGLMAWHADGTAVSGWPTEYLGQSYAAMGSFGPTIIKTTLGDNGFYVTAYSEWDTNKVKLFNNNGDLIGQISIPQPYKPFGLISSGDLNGDGNEDLIIHGNQNGQGEVLFAYNLSGMPIWHNPIPFYGINQDADYVLADINSDGKSEVIVVQCGTQNNIFCYIYIYDDKGQALPGWNPKDISLLGLGSPRVSIADINTDGFPEIIVAFNASSQNYSYDYHVILDKNGNELKGFPKPPEELQIRHSYYDTIVGVGVENSKMFPSVSTEWNGDVKSTILALHQYNGELSPVTNFPKELCVDSGDCFMTSGAIAITNTTRYSRSLVTAKYQHNKLHLMLFDIGESSQFKDDWPQVRQNSRKTNSFPVSTIPSIPTPTPTPVPNSPPKILDNSLPSGKVGVAYVANVEGLDNDELDVLSMTVNNLPNGLSLRNCNSKIVLKRSTIKCTVVGIPTQSDTKKSIFSLSDNQGKVDRKILSISIAP